jgi:hypothetical protein
MPKKPNLQARWHFAGRNLALRNSGTVLNLTLWQRLREQRSVPLRRSCRIIPLCVYLQSDRELKSSLHYADWTRDKPDQSSRNILRIDIAVHERDLRLERTDQ